MTQEFWNKKFEEPDHFGTGPTAFAQACADFLKAQNIFKKKLLDLGCGQGRDSLYFSGLGYAVTAVDYSSQALAFIKDKNITLVQQDLRSLDFPENSFDIVYSNLVFHCLKSEELPFIFSEIYQLLVPGGFFFFAMKKKDDKNYGQGEKIADETFVYKGVTRYFIPRNKLEMLLEDFNILKIEEGSHLQDNKLSVYWKVFAQKKIV